LARGLCGIGGEDFSHDYMHRLAVCQRRTQSLADAGETAFGGKWGDMATPQKREPFGVTEASFIWALKRGYVVASTTLAGHCFYSLTPTGWAKVDDPTWTRPEIDRSRRDDEWTDLYRRALAAAQGRIDETDPGREIGPIPAITAAGRDAKIASEYREVG
jgi:hypothetical protein